MFVVFWISDDVGDLIRINPADNLWLTFGSKDCEEDLAIHQQLLAALALTFRTHQATVATVPDELLKRLLLSCIFGFECDACAKSVVSPQPDCLLGQRITSPIQPGFVYEYRTRLRIEFRSGASRRRQPATIIQRQLNVGSGV